ncbi:MULTISPECIES: sucrose-specific PTS transporter subunit IIBC [Bacillus]|uniref:PTS sucrose transporter subunit IIBC n=1 Tax=Bacillus anthracis TaxID=1392 RepID=A0A2B0Y8A6_BACAN|nr:MULTISPECIES: sucrose-specific PTS transporter subunit IIBC [Bacillus]MBJ8060227.1 PTS sucrose transporter subunit IIBC [Bacillus cereus]MCU4758958.1 sucrose-specific PTS transporter subunit IIBC [Bacillus cereus]MCU5107798.1 sucrose-specific PTS transporter subunit IIBC [Bacillus cereus]MDF2021869.1 sucrose-specific PTS transporter subunit IIBC [Bacillus sp. Cr_R3]MDF2035082.1 sucrose-specific PTS transporter subunit IIBC [Bacillus sp. Cr_R16]
MNMKQIATQVLQNIGGKENIVRATHCATRLRLVLKDETKINASEIENIDEVKGAFATTEQYQIIFGTGIVNKVYAEFSKLIGISELDSTTSNDISKKKMNPIARLAKTLSNIFVPIIPAIVASGLLMGLLGMLKAFKLIPGDHSLIQLLDMFSSAAFIILPILIGVSAAKEFGGNIFLGAVVGGILTHPSLTNPWTLSNAKPTVLHFLGMNIDMIGYQGTVLPILLCVYVMSTIEKELRKRVPNSLDLLVTPFLTIIITGFLSLIIIGPIGYKIGDGITYLLNTIYQFAGPVAGLIFGGLYSTIVLTGLHHSFHAIEAGLLANKDIGVNFLLPIWSMANVAQGGATLAVYFKTKNKKTKEIAIPAAASAFLGITEPAIFGVNLKLGKPFIAAAIGGAIGGAYVVWMQVAANAYGLTGIPMLTIVAPLGIMNMIHYIIGLAIAIITAFVATFILYKESKQ